jgi:hypothetical protein
MESSRSSSPSWFSRHPVLRIFAYYLVLALGIYLLQIIAPDLQGVFNTERFSEVIATGKDELLSDTTSYVHGTPQQAAFESLVGMSAAVLLMIPVAWVYILTRAKRGFTQSTVQTLIFLPI